MFGNCDVMGCERRNVLKGLGRLEGNRTIMTMSSAYNDTQFEELGNLIESHRDATAKGTLLNTKG